MKKEQYEITGMSCAACSARVEKCVSALEGTKDVSVNLLTNQMQISYDESALSSAEIEAAVKNAGYEARLKGAETATSAKDISLSAAEEEFVSMKQRLISSLCFMIPLYFHGTYDALAVALLFQRYRKCFDFRIDFTFSDFAYCGN